MPPQPSCAEPRGGSSLLEFARSPWGKRLLSLGALALLAWPAALLRGHARRARYAPPLQIDAKAPAAREVKKLLRSLRYSGFEALMRPDVLLTVDLRARTWTLRNLRRWDDSGKIVLEQGNAGMCAELALAAHSRLKELLGGSHEVKIVRVAESAYFPPNYGVHFAVHARNRRDPSRVYVLDPSFRRYGPFEDFEDYVFIKAVEPAAFFLPWSRHYTQGFQTQVPILLRHDGMLALALEPGDGSLDAEHAALALYVKSRHRYRGRPILRVTRKGAGMTVWKDPKRAGRALTRADLNRLSDRLQELLKGARVLERTAPASN